MRRPLTLLWLSLCVVLIALWLFAPPPAAWINAYYTDGFYAALARVLVPLSGGVALPLTPILLLLLVVVAVLGGALTKNPRGGWRALGRWAGRGALVVLSGYALFIVIWGGNYGRTPIDARLGLSTEVALTTPEHVAFAEVLSNVIRQDWDAEADWDADLAAGMASLKRVIAQLEGRRVTLPRHVKLTPPGALLFTGQATGLMVPWTLEAYVDGSLPYAYRLATALHEAAHVAGYAGEAEADFVAAVAGLTSDNASVRYSTAATFFARSAPYNLLPERYQAIVNYLPKRFTQDLEALHEAYDRYRAPEPIRQLQTGFYNGYLRSQRVDEGVADYGRAITLLMAAKRDDVLEFNWEEVLLHLPSPAG